MSRGSGSGHAGTSASQAIPHPTVYPQPPVTHPGDAQAVAGEPGRRLARMKVSTRGDYACRALLSLALHGGEGPTSVRDIAERTALPQPYLEQILLALKGAGIVRSKRGVGGGYVLARPANEITLAQIVSAVDGPIAVGDFGEPHQNGACDHEGQCVLLAVWANVGEHMRRLLEGRTVADIAAIARGEAPWPDPVDDPVADPAPDTATP